MATAEQSTISTDELFGRQTPQVAEPAITQPEAQTVSTEELFSKQDTPTIPVSTTINPESDEQISTQQEEPIGMVAANRIKDFFGYNDTTNKRYQTAYEISQEFGIPLDQAQDDKVYRNLVSDTFSTEKPLDRVSSELMSVSFMAAAGAGLVTAPLPTMKALAYFGVANEVVSLALSSKWDGMKPNLEDYDFSKTRTLVDDVPKNSPPWLYAVAEVTDFLAKAGMVGGAMKGEAALKGKVKKGVEDIFAKYKEPLALTESKVAPKELPLGTQETGMPKDTTKIPVSTELQPQVITEKKTLKPETYHLQERPADVPKRELGAVKDQIAQTQEEIVVHRELIADAKARRKPFLNSIRRTDDFKNDELLDVPAKFITTRSTAPALDNAAQYAGYDKPQEFIDMLMTLESDIANSESAISGGRDAIVGMEKEISSITKTIEPLPPEYTDKEIERATSKDIPVAPDGMPSKPLPMAAQQQLIGTPLEGAKSSVEVRAKISSDLGITPQELAQSGQGVGWAARWQSDGHLLDSHPIVKWGVEKLAKENIEADERHLQVVKLINEVAGKARKGGSKRLTMEEDPTGVSTWQKDVRRGKTGALWDKLVPTDPLVSEFLQSSNKAEIAKRMTPEELDYALVLNKGWERMFDLAYEAEKINSKLDNYVTHIRRNFIEAWKSTGDFGLAFKESRANFLHDIAQFKTRDPKTGKRLPFEKSFQYARERKGGIKPTENMAKAFLKYNETFERMMAYNNVMPAIVEGVKSIKPKDPTPTENRAYEMLEKFIDQWGKNKKGIPADWAVDPQSEFAFYLKSARMFVSIMDLGVNPIIGAAAAVGEGSMNYMALGPIKTALGAKRGLTPEGKAILKKYESWIGRSPWAEIGDASHQITDGFMKSMFGFFQVSAVEANKIALLSEMTPAEFLDGVISSERLAKLRLLLNRHRYQKGMESIVENTVEGKFFGQYKFSWGLPPLATSMKNFKAGWKQVFEGKKMTDQQESEIRRFGELLFFATLLAKGYYPDKDDQSLSAKTRRKIARESFTTLGAAQMLLAPGDARVSGLNLNIVMGTYETLKGVLSNSPELIDKGVKKLKNVAVPGAIKAGLSLVTPEKIQPPSKQKKGTAVDSEISYLDILEDTAPNRR